MAKQPGCLARLVSLVIVIAVAVWGINACSERSWQARKAEEERQAVAAKAEQNRRAALTPEQRGAEDRKAAEEKAKAAEEKAKAELEERMSMREFEAQQVSEEHIRRFLKHPDDAHFGFWSIPETTWNAARDTFFVSSKVKAKNDFGGEFTYRWATIVFFDGQQWQLVSCMIDGKKVYEDKTLHDRLAKRAADPPKPDAKQQPEPKPKTRTPEETASAKLNLAQNYLRAGMKEPARRLLEAIVREYPNTAAAAKARRELVDVTE